MKEKTVKCADCTESVPEVDAWWCRDCVKSLCKACNLVKGHTEHRSRKWEKIEILNTCAQALESRCSLRSKEAADEEIAIKEFVAEVEAILVRKVHRRLEAVNERDRLIISRLNRALGEMDQQHKKEGCSSPIYHVPSPNGPAWKQYDSSDNNRVEMLVTEAAAIVNLTGYDIKPYVSITTTNESTPSLTRQQHSFAVLPDAFTAERFARIILESSNVRHRIGSLSNGSPAPNGDGLHMAPIAEDETRSASFFFKLFII
uniref:B box-type domain-containing protein n=1 Tax=Plectus sambesii TaxID=2011161 RepID=A0A914W398_9BILA